MKLLRSTLFLHVGLPKTGSSTLQRRLHQNCDDLAQQDIWYPEPSKSQMPKHQYLVSELLHGKHARLEHILQSAQCRDVLLTSEGLTNHLYDFPLNSLETFREITADYDVICLVVLRRQADWTKSYYKQCIINPRIGMQSMDFYGSGITLAEFRNHPRIQALSNFEQLQRDISQAYGAQQVHVFHLEEAWMDAIDQTLGIDTSGWTVTPDENISPSDSVVEILRQINTYALPEPERMQWIATLQAFAGSNHTSFKAALENSTKVGYKLNPEILAKLKPNLQADLSLSSETLKSFNAFVRSI